MKKTEKTILIILVCLAVIFSVSAAVLYINDFHIEMLLSGESDITLEYGQQYTETGASAHLKGKYIYKNGKPLTVETQGTVDTTKIGEYTVKYTSKTRFKNAQVSRTVKVVDTVAPIITLSGNETISLVRGSEYKESGFLAEDNYDGVLTDNVTIDGTVDTSTSGEYVLTYEVKDSSGNVASAKRTVKVYTPASKPSSPSMPTAYPGEKTVYLTFDDGPGGYTSKLLDVLAKYNVKATFFVIKTGASDLLTRMANEGHAVGIHTATHNYKSIYSSEEAFFSEVEIMQDIIQEKTGSRSKLIRFPGGSSNLVSRFNPGIMTRLAAALTEKGYRYFDWNVDSMDAGGATTTQQVANNVINGISKRGVSVVLQHDIKGFSVNAVEQIIKWGLANGYTFKALDTTSPACQHGIQN